MQRHVLSTGVDQWSNAYLEIGMYRCAMPDITVANHVRAALRFVTLLTPILDECCEALANEESIDPGSELRMQLFNAMRMSPEVRDHEFI